jgi:hypothetical protein
MRKTVHLSDNRGLANSFHRRKPAKNGYHIDAPMNGTDTVNPVSSLRVASSAGDAPSLLSWVYELKILTYCSLTVNGKLHR